MKLRYLVMVPVLALVVTAAGWSREDGGSTITMRVVERATTDTVVDIGPVGDSRGDVLAFANGVYDADDQVQVGTDNGHCIRTSTTGDPAWECFWTLTLRKGQLTVEGPFFDAHDSVLAITGGTGAFRRARGEMALHARDAAGSEYDFVYRINN
jgi:allene oxide cyclase